MTADYVQQHWLAILVLASALALAGTAFVRPASRRGLLVGGLLVGLVGIGGLSGMEEPWPIGLLATTAALLAILVAILASTGFWTPWLGVPVALFGAGTFIGAAAFRLVVAAILELGLDG